MVVWLPRIQHHQQQVRRLAHSDHLATAAYRHGVRQQQRQQGQQ